MTSRWRRCIWLLIATISAGLGWWFYTSSVGTAVGIELEAGPRPAPPLIAGRQRLPMPPGTRVELAPPPSAPAAIEEEPTVELLPLGINESRITVRFLLPSGANSTKSRVVLMSWRNVGGRSDLAWPDIEALSNEKGVVDVRFVPLADYQLSLQVHTPGAAMLQWRWGSIEPGAVERLGTVQLPPAGTVRGVIQTEFARSAFGLLVGYGDSSYRPRGIHSEPASYIAPVKSDSFEFRLDELPPGKAMVWIGYQDGGHSRRTEVDVVAGREVEARILP